MFGSSRPYCYVEPEVIISTCTPTESDGTQLIFACPMCGGKASFSLMKRVGRCFVCTGIIMLHRKYDDIPIEEVFKDLAPHMHVSAQVPDKPAPRAEIVTRLLSQTSLDYITSRGIPMDVVQQFGLFEETTYRGRLYLTWPTDAGGYELRAPFQNDEWAKITPRGHTKSFTLAKLVPHASTCIVCEGVFSALSYAQLFYRLDVWYVMLNSTSNTDKLVTALPSFQGAGITDVILALDHDKAGNDTSDALAEDCQEPGLRVHRHIPPRDGEDWNDALLRGGEQPPSQEVGADHQALHGQVSPTDRDGESSATVLVHDVDAPPDTVGSLSHADQAITADYYDRVLATYPRAVIAAPCGIGKTHAAAEYMARRQQEGVLYVAERTEQLKDMQQLLTTQYEVPAEMIGVYYTNSADLKALHTAETSKPIALITQARMQLYAPQTYVMFHRHGSLQYRRLMIVDESLPALIILSVPMVFVEGLLGRMGLTWDDTGKLDPDEMDRRIHQIDALRLYAKFEGST